MKLPFEKRKPKILVKQDITGTYGKPPEERTLKELLQCGVIVLNKPAGPTSHQTAEYAKNILKVKKAGHGGTLDPAVSGTLVIALNKATRINQFMLSAGKEYICLMHIHKENTKTAIKEAIKKYTGKIQQLPPVRSAVKRRTRTREVYYAKTLEIQDKDVLVQIGCHAGTYIRKWCHDIGNEIGGAHMAQLIRTKAGPFNDQEWYTLQDLADADEKKLLKIIKPIEDATKHLKKVWISDGAVNPICHGANLNVPGIAKIEDDIKAGDTVAIFTLKNELVSIGKAKLSAHEMMFKKKGKAITTQKVFLEPNYFPKVIESPRPQ